MENNELEMNGSLNSQRKRHDDPKKASKALFTLAYLVSFELRKLFQIPTIRSFID